MLICIGIFFFFKSAIITVDINFHTPLHSQTFITFIRCGFFSTLCFGKLHWLFNRLVVLILVLSCHKHLMAAGIVREVAILKGNQRFSRENAWDLCQFNLRISGIKPIWRIIRMSFLKVPAFCIFTRYTWKYSCYNSETVPCVVVEILGISLIFETFIWYLRLIIMLIQKLFQTIVIAIGSTIKHYPLCHPMQFGFNLYPENWFEGYPVKSTL